MAKRIIVTIASVTITPLTEFASTVRTQRIFCLALMRTGNQSGGRNNYHHTDQNKEQSFGSNY